MSRWFGWKTEGSEVSMEWELEENIQEVRAELLFLLMAVAVRQHALLCSANAGRQVNHVGWVVSATSTHTKKQIFTNSN